MTDSNPYDELKADLEYWCNLSENSFSNYLANEHDTLLAEESTGSASFDQFRNEFEIVQNTCKKFLEVYDYATLIPDIQKLLKLVDWFTAAVRKYLNTSESIAPDTLSIYMIGFENMLNDSLKYILSIINFTYKQSENGSGKMTLTMYSERGVLIHSDPGYSTSPIGKLESHVLDHIESIKILKDQIRNGTEEESRLLNVFMFYALAAPSMEGKTQSAFAFKTILPLYFLLINMYLSAASVSMQEIYRNFAKLSDKFRKIAISDLKLFQSKISLNVNDFISPQELVKNHGDFKFLILGFLIALIEHANENFGSSGKCWMEFFTTSPRNFTISPMSINEVRRLDLGNYVLFFDEFEAADWSVFVRNLARAALIPVFVSNTNTKAIKPVERDQRSESDFMWALVCTHLNAMNMRIYSGMNSQNLSKMDLIALAAGNEQELG